MVSVQSAMSEMLGSSAFEKYKAEEDVLAWARGNEPNARDPLAGLSQLPKKLQNQAIWKKPNGHHGNNNVSLGYAHGPHFYSGKQRALQVQKAKLAWFKAGMPALTPGSPDVPRKPK
jgi:hypothetical protein